MKITKKTIIPKNKTRILITILCLLSIFTAGLLAWRFYCAKEFALENAKEKGHLLNKQAAEKIDVFLNQLKSTVHELAQAITLEKIARDKITDYLMKKKSPNMNGLGVAFIPFAYEAKTKSYAPYYVNHEEKPKLVFLEKFYDYTQINNPRFPAPSKGSFHTTFSDPVNNILVIEYSEPFFDKDKKPIGIVFANYSIERIQKLVEMVYPGHLANGYIDSERGISIVDPEGEYKTRPEIARESGDPKLAHEIERALKSEISFIETSSDWLNAQKAWIYFDTIKSPSWLAVGVFSVSQLMGDTKSLNRQLIDAFLAILLAVITLLISLFCLYSSSPNKWWIFSWIISIGFVIAIIFIWNNAHSSSDISPTDQLAEKSSFDIKNIIKTFNISSYLTSASDTAFTQIPTGIYIHQLLIDPERIKVTGYVWQIIPDDTKENIKPGVIFPQATDVDIKQIYTFSNQGRTTIGWIFKCTLQQSFDYSKYPFDLHHIKVALWPKSFDNTLLLIPDFYGYPTINPVGLPGIYKRVNQQNWQYLLSYFTYRKTNLLTNFGYDLSTTSKEKTALTALPQMSFDIIASRKIISTLILNLTPIIIILTLLFILLIMAPFFEFANTFAIIASLFFTSLIAYTTFKAYLPIQQIVFFDYLYFILQAVILAIAIITVLYYSKLNIRLIMYEHMLVPQLLFWPLITGTILLISLLFLY